MADGLVVGGKNAGLGELVRTLTQEGVPVPRGFATTSEAYWELLRTNDLKPKLATLLERVRNHGHPLEEAGSAIRQLFLNASLPEKLVSEVKEAYGNLCRLNDNPAVDVAVDGSVAIPSLAYGQSSGYAEIPSGTRNIKVTPAGLTSPVVIGADLAFEASKEYTVYAIDKLDNIDAVISEDMRAANPNDRRYLLYNPTVKMKVTTQGEQVINLLWDVIAAKGFEKDMYFEMAARDIRALSKL